MSEPEKPEPVADHVDHGPPDSYHPIYDSVMEWLDGERAANPTTKPPVRRRRTPAKDRAKQ